MEKRNRVVRFISVVLCAVCLCVGTIQNKTAQVQILDETVALSSTVGNLLTEGDTDVCVIPDKYNTGAKGELISVMSDCYISGVKFGTTGTTDRKLDLYYQTVEVPNTIIVENYDFSASDFKVYNVAKVEKAVTVIYRNCKFQSYTISGAGKVSHQFENCTFTHFAGANATFKNCYFGGGTDGDGINPSFNCTFTNCMIADLVQKADVAGEKHIDGYQIFGSTDGTDNTNIHLNNCRFEMPYIPFSTPSGALNSPLSIIMRYSDADDISFDNCYINGGLYYAMMVLANGNNVTNLSFKNIHLGETSKNPYNCDSEFKALLESNACITDTLYVASVRKMQDGIHLSVTNDTDEERILSVLTDAGVEEFHIPACPKGIDLVQDTVNYSDFPFDMDIVIADTEWVACFDTTDNAEQIRFVNWSNANVYADLNYLFPVKESVSAPIVGSVAPGNVGMTIDKNMASDETEEVVDKNTASSDVVVSGDKNTTKEEIDNEIVLDSSMNIAEYAGVCGNNVQYSLKNGILTLSGTGATYNYHSGKTAPWYDVRSEVLEVKVEEGITNIGNQLFAECTNLKHVILPEGVSAIGSNVFKRCSSLEYICIPQTLTSIGERSFTSSLKNVEYGGTDEEWDAIVIGNYNDGLLKADISYKEAEYILYSGMCGDCVEWTYSSNGTLTLSGQGSTYNYHSGKTAPWFSYAPQINNIVIEDGVTVIGNFIFRDCCNVVSLELPESVVMVGTNSFSRCKRLSELKCSVGLKVIGKNAFAATNITTVYYNGTLTEWNTISGNCLTTANVIYY